LLLAMPSGVTDVVVLDGAGPAIARDFDAAMTICGTLVPAAP
jgi:hypothetical protein